MSLSSVANFSISSSTISKLLPSRRRNLVCYSFAIQIGAPSKKTRRRTWLVRNSAEATPSEAEASPEAQAEEVSVGSPKGSTSLISAANVEKALRVIAITSVDHYERLGIPRGTSYEQVTVAYKQRCERLQSKGLEEEELRKEMELLKESYAILSSEEERRLYDWSLARSEKPDRYVWPFEVDITQTPTQPAPPKEPEDEMPTRIVGYAFLGWVMLSFVLFIVFNRD